MATTPEHGWPTPDNTDRVANGASAIRALGDAIDGALPFIYSTTGSVGSLAPGSDASVTVTFPASYFASAPRVVGTANTGGSAVVTVTSVSADSCSVKLLNVGATTIGGAFAIVAVL